MGEYAMYDNLVEVLKNISFNDNNIREQAEKWLMSNCITADPVWTLLNLVRIITSQTENEVRLQAILVLPLLFRKNDSGKASSQSSENPCDKVPVECLKTSLYELVKLLYEEPDSTIRTNLCATIGRIYRSDHSGRLPPLESQLLTMMDSPEFEVMQSGMKMFISLIDAQTEIKVMDNVNLLSQIIFKVMERKDIRHRVEGFNFIASAVAVQWKSFYKFFYSLSPLIVDSISEVLAYDASLAVQYTQNIVQISESDSLFWKDNLGHVVMVLLSFAQKDASNSDEGQVPLFCFEALICIFEDLPRNSMKIPDFLPALIRQVMAYMLDIGKDCYNEWLDTGIDPTDIEFVKKYDIGESAIDRLAKAATGVDADRFMKELFEAVEFFISCSDVWHYKFVAIMTISQTAEYIPNNLRDQLVHQSINILLQHIKDPHRHVRFAVCQAIAQIALDVDFYVQQTYSNMILPALLEAMEDSSLRVKSHACSAFVNFAEECDVVDIIPIADKVMNLLYSYIQPEIPLLLREQAITAVAVVAGVLEDRFVPYYSLIVPLIKKNIRGCLTEEERLCRGKAIESISIIGISVESELFLADGIETMQLILSIGSWASDNENPVKEYVQSAVGRICRALKEKCLPFLNTFMEEAFRSLAEEATLIPPNYFDDQNSDDDQDITMTNLDDGKCFAMRTAVIQDKQKTLDMLCSIFEALDTRIENWIEPCARMTFPLFSFVLSEDVRNKAFSLMGILIRISRSLAENDPSKKNNVVSLLDASINQVLGLMCREDIDVKDIETQIEGLQCLTDASLRDFISENQMVIITRKTLSVMEAAINRKIHETRAPCNESRRTDEDESDELYNELTIEQDLAVNALSVVSNLMACNPELFMKTECRETTVKFMFDLLRVEDLEVRALAFFFWDDFLENTKELCLPYWNDMVTPMLQGIIEPKCAQIRRACAYAIAVAKNLSVFPSILDQAVVQLVNAIRQEDTFRSEPNRLHLDQAATDNCIYALGEIIFDPNLENLSEMLRNHKSEYLAIWLNYLPLKEDNYEGPKVYNLLMTQLEQNSSDVWGPNNIHFFKILKILATVYKSEFSNADLDGRIAIIFKSMNQESIRSVADQLTLSERVKIHRIFSQSTV